MPNLEVLVSPQDLIALRSIYGHQKHIEESFHVYIEESFHVHIEEGFHVHMEANVCIWQFPRYLPISIQY